MVLKNFSTKEELKMYSKEVLRELYDTINNELQFRQARLLTFWLNTWNEKYIKNENTFNPHGLIKYVRGNVVKADLGYNVGSEEGGMHYGIVLDNNNDKSSKVVTIVTLRSLKDSESPEDIDTKFELYLGEALLTDKIAYVEQEMSKLKHSLQSIEPKGMGYLIMCSKINKYEKEYVNLKRGTVAIASQIRTISKMRICEPLRSYHSLSGFKISQEKMAEIDDIIKRLFMG